MREKLDELRRILRDMERVIVAYSGGVDSTFVLKVAHECLGDDVLAVTASSPSLPFDDLEEAKRMGQACFALFGFAHPVRHGCDRGSAGAHRTGGGGPASPGAEPVASAPP